MTFPSSLRLKNPSPSNQTDQQSLPSSLRLKKKPQESDYISDEEVEKDIERSQARTLSRMTETALGAPGDIASFFSGLFGKEQKILPKSSDIRSFANKASGGYLEPKTEFEKTGDELASDIASMGLPGTGKFGIIKNIGIPVIGTLVKEGLKYGKAEEKTQAYGKVGTMVALDLLSRKTGGAKKYATSLFQKAEEALPKGISVDASALQKNLDVLEKSLSAGGSRATSKKSLEKILEIRKDIRNGKIDAKTLSAYRPSINEAIEELGGFNLEVPKKLKPQAIRNLNAVKSEVIKTLDEYGQKFNPEYYKYSRDANEAWAAYKNSALIGNFIRNKITYSPKSAAVQSLFSLAPTAGITALGALSPGSAVGALAGVSAYRGYQVLDRVINSKVLRKYYLSAIKEAAAGNVAETTKNLKALDEHLKEKK